MRDLTFAGPVDGQDVPLRVARSTIGPDAKPSGRLRFLTDGPKARLQQEWVSDLGRLWLEVPQLPAPEHGITDWD